MGGRTSIAEETGSNEESSYPCVRAHTEGRRDTEEAICSVGGRILIAVETESSKSSYPVGIRGRMLVAQETDAWESSR